ncbi:MAG: hypothetical protein ACON4R_13345 [Akkermansiaceae bacterium]
MTKAILIARIFLGVAFVVFGISHTPPDLTIKFSTALKGSGFMDVVKGLEIAGGLALLSKRFAPLGLLILSPVVVNIVLSNIYLAQKFSLIGTAVVVVFTFLLVVYRRNFYGVLAAPRR